MVVRSPIFGRLGPYDCLGWSPIVGHIYIFAIGGVRPPLS